MLLYANSAAKQVAAGKKATCSEGLVVCCGELRSTLERPARLSARVSSD